MALSMFPTTAPVLSDPPTLEERRAMILWLQPPCYLPAVISQSDNAEAPVRQSTLVHSDNVEADAIHPPIIEESTLTMVKEADLVQHLNAILTSPDFPFSLFKANGALVVNRGYQAWHAATIRPVGKLGISQKLGSDLFDSFNHIFRHLYKSEDRYWQVVGVGGKAGSTDWGFFVDRILVVLLELQPHGTDSLNEKRRNDNRTSQNATTQQVIPHMFARFSANPTARFGVILTESCMVEGGADDCDPLYLSSSATLVERKPGHLALASQVFRADTDLDLDKISTPVELLFALSVIPKPELVLPKFNTKKRSRVVSSGSGDVDNGYKAYPILYLRHKILFRDLAFHRLGDNIPSTDVLSLIGETETNSPTCELAIGDCCGHGAVWEAYRTTDGRIIKTSDPSGIIGEGEDGHYEFNYSYTSADEVRAAIKTELDLLDGPLLHLQGSVVPQVYGMFVARKPDGQDVRAILMEDGGDPIKPADLLLHEKRAIIQKYTEIHQTGVLHNDIRLQNILRGNDSKITVIDFERSRTRVEIGEEDWETECEYEIASVMRKIWHQIL